MSREKLILFNILTKFIYLNWFTQLYFLKGNVSKVAKAQSKTPLSIALSEKNLTLLKLLTQNRVILDKELNDPKIKNILKTILKKSSAYNGILIHIMEHLSLDGKDILLTLATEVRAEEVVRKLFSLGADMNALNSQGNPPLMLALESKELTTFIDLIDRGANPETLFIDPKSSNNNAKTVLIMAAEKGGYALKFFSKVNNIASKIKETIYANYYRTTKISLHLEV
jgi:ankyrin repeat protein